MPGKKPKKDDKKAEKADKDSGEKSADDIRKEILIKNNLEQYLRVFKFLTDTVDEGTAPPPGVQIGDQALDTNACNAAAASPSRAATPHDAASRPTSGRKASGRSRSRSASRSRSRPPSAAAGGAAGARTTGDVDGGAPVPDEQPQSPEPPGELVLPDVDTQLDFAQFAAKVRALLRPTDVAQPDMAEFFAEFDKEGKGHVNFEEYVAGIATTDFEIQETFRVAEEKARKKAAKEAKAAAKAAKKAGKAKKKG